MVTSAALFWLAGVVTLLLAITAIYCIIVSRNLIRILIGVEIMTKAATLLLVAAGVVSGRTALAQALIITLIVVEVVVIAVAAGVVVGSYQHTHDMDVRNLRDLKG